MSLPVVEMDRLQKSLGDSPPVLIVAGLMSNRRKPLDDIPRRFLPRENSPEVTPRGSVKVVGRIGSGVRVSASFQIVALKMLLYTPRRYFSRGCNLQEGEFIQGVF